MPEQEPPAADPRSDHETPGGNPVNEGQDARVVETKVETPAGSSVTETAVQDSER